jgi:actin-related protein 10
MVEDFLVRALYVLPTPPSYPSTSTGIIPNEELRNTYASESIDTIEWFIQDLKQTVHIPKWICSRSVELFFEGDRPGISPDTDEIGIISSIKSCLSRLPQDIRSKLLQNILFVGGGSMIPGLRTRIKRSLQSGFREVRIVDGRPEAAFLGASLLGDLKVRGFAEVSRDAFNACQGRNVPDWTFVSGGNEDVEEKRKSRGL